MLQILSGAILKYGGSYEIADILKPMKVIKGSTI